MPGSGKLIYGNDFYRTAAGVWEPESGLPEKRLFLKQQVRIHCTRNIEGQADGCVEQRISLAVIGGQMSVLGPDETSFQLQAWDRDGLSASEDSPSPIKCSVTTLRMVFSSNSVTVIDTPTHNKDCEAFTEVNSYKLTPGNYYFDMNQNRDTSE